MPAPEEAVVDLFACAVQNGDIGIQILTCPVSLYGSYATVERTVDAGQEFGDGHVVGVHDNHYVIEIGVDVVHGHSQRFGFGAFRVIRHQ